MTKKERDILLPMTIGSGLLFGIGLCFSYFFLVPAALRFFITYGSEIVEPFWSFDQYFDFIAVWVVGGKNEFEMHGREDKIILIF